MNKIITPEIAKSIKVMREKGLTIKAIANHFNVCYDTVKYCINEDYRKNKINSQKKWFNSLSQKRKQEIYTKRKEYIKAYIKRRYNNDSEYREKIKAYNNQYRRKII